MKYPDTDECCKICGVNYSGIGVPKKVGKHVTQAHELIQKLQAKLAELGVHQ